MQDEGALPSRLAGTQTSLAATWLRRAGGRAQALPQLFPRLLALLVTLSSNSFAQSPSDSQSQPSHQAQLPRVIEHRLQSQYQQGETTVRVIRPAKVVPERRYPALYILPVEAGDEQRFGNSVTEALRGELADRWQVVCVFPTFSHLPWYADHPTNAAIRQESYLLKDVLPLVEREHPVERERAGRWLVGFSKSGWGAYSLLLRNPEVFDRAAAWDAPLMKDRPNQFGMGEIFGNDKAFADYQLTKLLPTAAPQFRSRTRLVLTGYDNFRDHHQQFHEQLLAAEVLHLYRDGPQRKHVWGSGWLPEAVELLVGVAPQPAPRAKQPE